MVPSKQRVSSGPHLLSSMSVRRIHSRSYVSLKQQRHYPLWHRRMYSSHVASTVGVSEKKFRVRRSREEKYMKLRCHRSSLADRCRANLQSDPSMIHAPTIIHYTTSCTPHCEVLPMMILFHMMWRGPNL